eukprot:157985_1
MKLFRHCRIQRIKPITNISRLSQIHKYHFTQTEEHEKSLEFSDLDDDSTIRTNPIMESLSQNKTFQTVSSDPSSPRRHNRHENETWKRQNRRLWGFEQETDSVFQPIKSAKTISELHKNLETFKQTLFKK